MKVSENKTKTLNVRFTEEDLRLLNFVAKGIGQTPSGLIRMYVSSILTPVKVKLKKGELNNEDIQTILDN